MEAFGHEAGLILSEKARKRRLGLQSPRLTGCAQASSVDVILKRISRKLDRGCTKILSEPSTMAKTLPLLPPDMLRPILDYVESHEVYNLWMTGCLALQQAFARFHVVRRYGLTWDASKSEISKIYPSVLSEWKGIQELSLTITASSNWGNRRKCNIDGLNFRLLPNSLTYLALACPNVFSAWKDPVTAVLIDLNDRLPHLKTLFIDGGGVFTAEHASGLPRGLENLDLKCFIHLLPAELLLLPQDLRSLSLTHYHLVSNDLAALRHNGAEVDLAGLFPRLVALRASSLSIPLVSALLHAPISTLCLIINQSDLNGANWPTTLTVLDISAACALWPEMMARFPPSLLKLIWRGSIIVPDSGILPFPPKLTTLDAAWLGSEDGKRNLVYPASLTKVTLPTSIVPLNRLPERIATINWNYISAHQLLEGLPKYLTSLSLSMSKVPISTINTLPPTVTHVSLQLCRLDGADQLTWPPQIKTLNAESRAELILSPQDLPTNLTRLFYDNRIDARWMTDLQRLRHLDSLILSSTGFDSSCLALLPRQLRLFRVLFWDKFDTTLCQSLPPSLTELNLVMNVTKECAQTTISPAQLGSLLPDWLKIVVLPSFDAPLKTSDAGMLVLRGIKPHLEHISFGRDSNLLSLRPAVPKPIWLTPFFAPSDSS